MSLTLAGPALTAPSQQGIIDYTGMGTFAKDFNAQCHWGRGVVVRNRSFSNNRRMTGFFSCVRYGQLAMICGRFTCKRVRLAETKNIALLLKWRVALQVFHLISDLGILGIFL